MIRLKYAAVLMSVWLTTGFGPRQTHPDFSGHWLVVPTLTEWTASYGSDITAKQSNSVLTISREVSGHTQTYTYNLDGSPSTNSSAAGAPESTSVATWQEDKLVIVSKVGGTAPSETTRTFSLQTDGTLLILTNTTVNTHGTTRTVYKRA